MSLDSKDDSKIRYSDASTIDMDFSSEEDLNLYKDISTSFNSFDVIHLLEPILPEVQEKYNCLQEGLRDIFHILEKEIEPVCIREERSLSSASVSLAGITRSSLCRRRSTLTQAVV